jgi:hypothetical protein
MSTFHAPRPGAPTFTAAPASLSLSGLDDFAALAAADSDVMDAEWYHAQDHYHHPHQHAQPRMSPVTELVVSAGFSFAPHTVPVAPDAFAGGCTLFFLLPPQSIRLFPSRLVHSGPCRCSAPASHRPGCGMPCRHGTISHAIPRDFASSKYPISPTASVPPAKPSASPPDSRRESR